MYLVFGRADSRSLQLYLTNHRLLQMRSAVNSHALPVYKTSLLCIFETTILATKKRGKYRGKYMHGKATNIRQKYSIKKKHIHSYTCIFYFPLT